MRWLLALLMLCLAAPAVAGEHCAASETPAAAHHGDCGMPEQAPVDRHDGRHVCIGCVPDSAFAHSAVAAPILPQMPAYTIASETFGRVIVEAPTPPPPRLFV